MTRIEQVEELIKGMERKTKPENKIEFLVEIVKLLTNELKVQQMKRKEVTVQSCLNCYNQWMCQTRTPNKYKQHFDVDKDIDNPCSNWQDDSVDWDECDD